MQFAALLLSLCLHLAIFLLIWFWPAPAPLRLDTPPMMISLVEGATGGNMTPSPILGHMGESGEGPLAPTPPAPQAEIAAPAREEIKAPDIKAPAPEEAPVPIKPEPVQIAENTPKPLPEPAPIKKPEPQKVEQPKPEPKKPEPKKPEAKKPEPKPEPPKKQPPKTPPKKPAPPKQDPVAAALQQARKATSRANSGDRGNAVEQALAQARKGAAGTKGGGGGAGAGPGGGGLGDVYTGQVMLAVRPNWGYASPGRRSLVCVVKVNVDLAGQVQKAEISRSSGNAQFDASAVNSIIRTAQAGQFPPPPNVNYTDLDLVFSLDELTGR